MPVSNRQLTAGDHDLFAAMNALFADVFEEPDTYAGAVPRRTYVETLLADPQFIAIVALDDEAVVGALAGYILPKFEQERSEAYIYDLAVARDRRRLGIATGLIGALKKAARDLGCHVIFVQADQGDTPAIRLYESLGSARGSPPFRYPLGRLSRQLLRATAGGNRHSLAPPVIHRQLRPIVA